MVPFDGYQIYWFGFKCYVPFICMCWIGCLYLRIEYGKHNLSNIKSNGEGYVKSFEDLWWEMVGNIERWLER